MGFHLGFLIPLAAAMVWLQVCVPFHFKAGSGHADIQPLAQCPVALAQQLAANELEPNQDTARDGNCGPHAFAISMLDQSKYQVVPGGGNKQAAAIRKRFFNLTGNARIQYVRDAACSWLKEHRPAWGRPIKYPIALKLARVVRGVLALSIVCDTLGSGPQSPFHPSLLS